jgi:hypothetical protein
MQVMNQAIFQGLLLRVDDLQGQQQPVFLHLARLGHQAPAQGRRNGQGPHSSGGLGSNVGQMVRRQGLEPCPPD